MNSKRPILILEKSRSDKIIAVLILITVLSTWILAILSFNNLPEMIPVHYNAKGEVDNYGSKLTIWILPVISSLIIAGMHYLNKFPHIFNYLVKITAENALSQYTAATKMIRYIQVIVALVFLFIVYDIIHTTHSGSSLIGA